MSYAELLAELRGLRRFGVRPALGPTREALFRLGDPQESLRIAHVAGTNGKGSTAAMIDAAMQAAGRRTGLYTSPHLSRFTERIRVNGREISREDVVRLARVVRGAAPELTFFETATCVALLYFAERRVDVAVLETGLGGRLDATNVVRPAVTVVTRIGLDHTEHLGADVLAVAREKAGIMKPDVPGLAVADGPERDVLIEGARSVGAPLRLLGRDFPSHQGSLGLPGEHQRENAALAREAASVLGAQKDAIARGLGSVRWPGRLEHVGRFVLDCAHNPQAAAALAAAVGRTDALIFGCLQDKDAAGMLAALQADEVWFVRPRTDRARDPAELVPRCPGARVASLAEALERASRGTVLLTGSTYLVGEARELLLGEEPDPVSIGDPSHKAT
jgi:dihydrofolate synthase / folylpolyglutamate synthase